MSHPAKLLWRLHGLPDYDSRVLGRLDNGLGFYRFSYDGSEKAYVGVMAQEVQAVRPEVVVRGSDGYLRPVVALNGNPDHAGECPLSRIADMTADIALI